MVRTAFLHALLTFSLTMLAQVAPPPPPNASLQTQLKNAVLARWNAQEHGDFQAYAVLLDDGFTMVSDDGSVYTKASLIKLIRQDQQAGTKAHNSEPVEIRVWSSTDIATMSYKTTNTVPFAGQKIVTDQVDVSKFDAYVGQYETAPGSIVKVWREGNRLLDQWPGDQRMRDLPLTESVFCQQGRPGLLHFVRDETGAVTGFQLWIGDSTIVGRKVR